MLRQEWADDLYEGLFGVQARADALRAICAWQGAEHGPEDPAPASTWNPLNTTLHMPGATPFNTLSDGRTHVWNYPDFETGLEATIETLHNGDYPGILDDLENGSDVQICTSIDASVWGTRSSSRVLEAMHSNPLFLSAPVAGLQPASPTTVPPDQMPVLKKGSSGNTVVYLQELLDSHGFPPANSLTKLGQWDGIFGEGTDMGVRLFQAHLSLTIDGIVGPQTWTALVEHPTT